MSKDWRETARDASKLNGQVARGLPEVAKAFSQMTQAASAEGELDGKTKELIALAVAISAQCEACIALHTKSAVKMGVSRQEMLEMIGVAIYMGGGPSFSYGAQALEAFDQLSASDKKEGE